LRTVCSHSLLNFNGEKNIMKARKSLLSLAVLMAASGIALADNSTVKAYQDGTYNQMTATQSEAVGSSLTVEQRGDRNRVGLSTSGVSQTAKSSALNISQRGSDNTAFATQSGERNTAIIQQSGSANDQLGSIEQAGSANYAKIAQEVNSGVMSATILQTSLGNDVSDNTAHITQRYSGDYTTASIGQFGTHSSAEVSQRNALGSVGDVTQSGAYNKATVRQEYTTSVEGRATQTGDQLTASVTQSGVQNSKLYVTQTGNFSTVESTQQNGHDLKISVRQQGDNSAASSRQSGAYNEADLFQAGNNNQASITQTGQGIGTGADRNQVYLTQMGNSLTATVTQAGGAGNLANITQR